ncbi:hypothetical protein FACS1894156_0940 [Bacteroidia bacterium]|nr:hypothetical protein FACS1894156_0940 [Bacteroidia bacterium]
MNLFDLLEISIFVKNGRTQSKIFQFISQLFFPQNITLLIEPFSGEIADLPILASNSLTQFFTINLPSLFAHFFKSKKFGILFA